MTHPEFTQKDIEQFWSNVDRREPDDCWEWQGARQPRGYGVIRLQKRQFYGHRLAYTLTNGPIPEGLHICHHCDNPPCVNPAHLFAGTAKDNMQDAKAKGRTSPPPLTGEQRRHLTMADAVMIRARYHAGESMPQLAAAFGLTWASIRTILDNESYIDPAYVRTRFRDRRRRVKWLST